VMAKPQLLFSKVSYKIKISYQTFKDTTDCLRQTLMLSPVYKIIPPVLLYFLFLVEILQGTMDCYLSPNKYPRLLMLLKIKLNFFNKFSKIQFLALNRTSTGQITKFGVLIHIIKLPSMHKVYKMAIN
jgi:hypothetical protein